MRIQGQEVVEIREYPNTLLYILEDGSILYGPKEASIPVDLPEGLRIPPVFPRTQTVMKLNRAGRRAQKRAL